MIAFAGSDAGDPERAALAIYPQLRRLLGLRHGGWVFQPIWVDGLLELLTGSRTWPLGWSDAIAIRDIGDAKAYRCDPAGGQVWCREGSLVEVVDAVTELPAPGLPGAPVLVAARRPALWTP